MKQSIQWMLAVFICTYVLLFLAATSNVAPDYWDERWLKENTAIEMHAHDIYQNNKSTLTTFTPQNCVVRDGGSTTTKVVQCIELSDTGAQQTYSEQYVAANKMLFPSYRER